MQSRLHSKTLASPARIWGLLAALLVLFLVTRSFVRQSPAHPYSFYNRDTLHPKNYLNASASAPVPFDFCPVHGPGDAIGQKYGVHLMGKSRIHTGTGARIQRVIHKALSGRPVTISVLGGSIASCHGAGNDPLAPGCWPARFFMWWNSVFPHPGSQLTNGARRRTNSAYFSFCHGYHLPDETDLVILDFDTEDDAPTEEIISQFEQLVRSILTRQDQPAVLLLGHFAPQNQARFAFHGPEMAHTAVAQFYDVPHISVKGAVYNEYITNPEPFKSAFYADPMLSNQRGHELMADVLVGYFQSQICTGWSAILGYSFDVPLVSTDSTGAENAKGLFGGIRHTPTPEDSSAEEKEPTLFNTGPYAALRVPPARLGSRPHELEQFRESEPFCAAADNLINPLPPSLFYGSGWHAHHPGKGMPEAHEDEVRHYWFSNLPGSKLRVPIKVGRGDIALYYLEEGRTEEEIKQGAGSTIECWVDDNHNGRKSIENTFVGGASRPQLFTIDKGVQQGSHFVECSLMGEEGQAVDPFKILGIFAT